MATELTVTGNTRLTWSLADVQATSTVSRAAEQKSNRSVSHGTGANQANVAWSEQYTTTGTSSLLIDSGYLPASSFDFGGYATVTKAKEVLLSVSTGPTGGYVTFGMPTGVTGVRVNVGGQFHWLDYLSGLAISGNFSIANGITGTYMVELSVVGNGTFNSL